MYCAVGVDEGAALGSRPSKARWVGVKGMSVRSSFAFASGKRAVPMLNSKTKFSRMKNGCAYACACLGTIMFRIPGLSLKLALPCILHSNNRAYLPNKAIHNP